ncbi:MAG: nicotinate (nicotinamide) nucleotide adenylyltransferase [Bacteroidales bacterium]|nr:nicotinate (nicotinamide) nucleotide adenylyltransferase [Bacteroidales bacterium]
MNVAVFPGSFNPLHIGHLAIMKCLTEDAKYDVVYLIVSPKNPIKDINPLSANDRYLAAVEAAERHPEVNVKVDDIELHMEAPQYTFKTLNALREREPENTFTLVMGADNLGIIKRWKNGDYILKEFGVCVYPRDGYDLDAIIAELKEEDPDYKIDVVDAPKVNMSSTFIREGLAEGKDMSEYLM